MHIKEIYFGLSERERGVLGEALLWTKDYYDNVPLGTPINGHGFDKTMRQAGMAAKIASGEGFPVFLPVLTAMVMDVGRATDDPRSRDNRHGELSREMVVARLFPSLRILTIEDQILVANAIEDHPKLNINVRRNPVVEIAMDSDRLDCIGLLGPLRAASGRPNIPLILPGESDTRSADNQIQTIWQDMYIRHMEWVGMLWTKTAKIIAEPRVKAYRRYLKGLQKEASFSYKALEKLAI